jgi:Protein of unknown function (DUF2782)
MSSLRKACLFAAAAALAGSVFAQAPANVAPPPMPANVAPPPLPANVAPPPLPSNAAPPPPIDYSGDADLDPQVTVIRKDEETLEEVRVGGTLRYVRVTPRRGPTYYLVPSGNGQTFNRMDSLGSGLSVPMWLLFSW